MVKPFSTKTKTTMSEQELKEKVKAKAREIWEKRGRPQGKDVEIWVEAERIVKGGK